MTWFKVDDGFYTHPKVMALESGPCFSEAIALWVMAGSWCAGHLQNGKVPASLPRKLGFKPRAEKELLRVKLWSRIDEGFLFHDWHKYQPTKAEIESRRAATKERVDRHRSARRNGVTQSVGSAAGNDSRHGVGNASPVPTSPVLDPPNPPDGGGGRAAPSSPEGATTVALVSEAVKAVARARQLAPTPLVPQRDLESAAERVDEAVQEGVSPDPATAARALVEAAFALHEGPRQRPLRFALSEASIAPNGRSAAQARHVPPEDPWV